jgi:MFS family permease
MVAAAVGWQIYAHTHQALALAMVGLAMAVPHYLLFLPAGDKVDRGDRRDIFLFAQCALLLSSLVLGWTNWRMEDPTRGLPLDTYLTLTYGCLLVMGGSFAFLIPAKQSFFPLLVPHQAIPNAVTWNSTVFHRGTSRAALADCCEVLSGRLGFLLDAGCRCVLDALSLPPCDTTLRRRPPLGRPSWRGVRFVRDTP